ncbi:MAG: PQQ-binding-like beta-propeller repeat protein [Planctomycetota bacterium]
MTYERSDRRWFRVLAAGCLAVAAILGAFRSPGAFGQEMPPIEESGVAGGLVVWIGGDLTPADWAAGLSELDAKKGLLVLGLSRDAEVVRKTRAALAAPAQQGAVSLDTFQPTAEGALPLVDNSVNLLVVSSGGGIPKEEIVRVLAPLGSALVEEGGKWSKITKPWPADIDEWTHYLHDASNNAVSHDERVGPPRHLQWQCGPRWGRHHDHMASVSAMVSARGRVFYILDEGSRHSPQLPPDWKLVARDAFNGVLLWKRPIQRWHDNLWPLKSGPASLPRRLVAQGEVVYATLGIDAPVAALDAATGQTIREYEGTAAAEEIVYSDGTLLVLVNRTPVDLEADLAADPEEGQSRDSRTTYSPTMGRIWAGVRSRRWTHGDRSILAFDAETGRPLWAKAGRVIPLTLGADANHVYYHDGDKIVALEVSSGQERWVSEPVPVWQGLHGQGLQSWFAPTLLACDGKVLFAGGEKIHMSYMGWGSEDIGQDTMTAFSADSGKKLWTADHPYSGYNSPEDLFVAAGKVWTGITAKGGPDGRYMSHNLDTGEKRDDFPPTVDTFWFHHRCYRAKATDKYILSSRTGIEFVDLATGEWTIHHWVRGGCLYGIMPSNGLVYSPLHPCSCYAEAKLNGFTALAASRGEGRGVRGEGREAGDEGHVAARLERGPAYQAREDKPRGSKPPTSHPWPTYRHDPARSGATSDAISTPLGPQWTVELGGRLTQPVAGGGLLFVADVDRHTVHAVDAQSGERLWSYAAGGRIDSPPTYDRGRLVFGSANGYVYCLRAGDGALAWRFRAAPVDRRLVAFDSVESVWPVHGAVLVEEGVVSAVAGRSIYLDGGLRFSRLDVETGRLLSETVLDDRDPETGEDMQTRVKGLDSPVALPDVLASDGERLYMRSETLDLEGNRLGAGAPGGRRDHLFAPYGFTDDSWFHRVYWVFGNGFRSGVGGYSNGLAKPAGRILVNNDSTVFGYGRKPEFYRWTSVRKYQLFAAARPGSGSGPPKVKPDKGKSKVAYRWAREVPMMVCGMALAGKTLLIAGPPDLIDEEAAFQTFPDDATQKRLALQDAALKGQGGAMLQAVDADTGETLAECPLDSPPVFDGLIVAHGRVFLATMDGRLRAFGQKSDGLNPHP